MRNNIAFLDNGEGTLLPDNLANFRDITLSDRDRREKKCKILATMLNYHLGWFLNTNDHSSALGTAETQYDIEKLNSIGPIKYTARFRLSPGEAKRVADRLQYVPLVFEQNGKYYRNSRRLVKSNRSLTTPIGGTPSVIVNKFKRRGSRSNYYNASVIKVNNHFWDDEHTLWDALIANSSRQNYYGRGLDHDYRNLVLRNLVSENGHSEWTVNEERVNYNEYTNQIFAADLFNYLKSSLTRRRSTPEIVYSDEEDYTQLREFLTDQTENMVKANVVLKGMASIDKARIFKTQGALYMTYRITMHEPGVHFKHPSGESRHDTYVRQVQDIHGNNADFVMGVQCKLSWGAINFRVRRSSLAGFTNLNHDRPNLYNIHGSNSTIARDLANIFDAENDHNDTILFSGNNCLSEHERGINRSADRLDYLTLCMKLLNWHQIYVPTRTQPYEHPNKIFFGIGNDIPAWYMSLHDSSTDRCRDLIVGNYSNGGSTLDGVSNEDLRGLSLNHCGNCHNKSSGAGCTTFNAAITRAFGRNSINLYTAALAEHNKNPNVEVCAPTPAAVETIVEEVLGCEHGNSGPSDCLDCETAVFQRAFEAIDPGVAAQEIEDECENFETERERTMRLMAGWVQSER